MARKLAVICLFPFFLVAFTVYEFCRGVRRAARDSYGDARIACEEIKDFLKPEK